MTPKPKNPGGDGGSGGPGRRRRGRQIQNVAEGQEDTGEAARAGRAGQGQSAGGRQPDRRTVPYGFDDFQGFQQFATRYRDRMREQYPDLDMAFQGSAVTGRSHDTGRPFDEGRTSDYDIAVSGDSIYRAAQERGIEFRSDGVSTGPLTDADLRALGLDGIVGDASGEAGRKVNIMIYRTMDEATDRKPSIRVWF
jgi:filamentous hemagglutinin